MHHRHHRRRPSVRRCLFFIGLAAAVVAMIFIAASYLEEESHVQERGVSESHIGQRRRVEHEGKTYAEKTGLTTILLLGVDKDANAVSYGARQGGQSDFMMLLVIDPNGKRISRLHIDRDTMTPVETLGVLGNPTGAQVMQICLAHGFGATSGENGQRATHAVETLLGIDVDFYMAVDMSAMGRINNALGGVTVTLEDDFSQQDPAMVKGATLTLTDEQAEIFLRGRMSVGDGTNASRMRRHQAYMTEAANIFRTRMEADTAFINTFMDALEEGMTANIRRNRIIAEANKAYRYDTPPVDTLPGEHRVGKDGFMEYHLAENAALQWTLRTCFEIME